MVALALSAILFIGAHGLLDALGAHVRGIQEAARDANARANGSARVHQALADVALGIDSVPSLTGDARHVEFMSWCDTPRGWKQACSQRIDLQYSREGWRVLISEGGRAQLVRGALRRAELRYLMSADYGGSWRERWEGTVMIPAAIGIIMDDDTLLAPIGVRR